MKVRVLRTTTGYRRLHLTKRVPATGKRAREGGGLLVCRRGPNRTKDIPGGKGGEGDGGEEGEDIEERGGLGA